jgi:uncharacterized membrane protein
MVLPDSAPEKPHYLREKFNNIFFLLVIIASSLLTISIALPYVSKGYELSRVFPISATILSIGFVIGGFEIKNTAEKIVAYLNTRYLHGPNETSVPDPDDGNGKTPCPAHENHATFVSTIPAYAILIIVLILYFLCSIGAVHTLMGVHRDILLNSEGVQYSQKFVHDSETFSAVWLRRHADPAVFIFSDELGKDRLMSQGLLNPQNVSFTLNQDGSIPDGYMYTTFVNTQYGYIYLEREWQNMSPLSHMLSGRSIIYSNNESMIYYL